MHSSSPLSKEVIDSFISHVHDRMTEQPYPEVLKTFKTGMIAKETKTVPVISEGRKALQQINDELGLSFDEQDLEYYTNLFINDFKRDPTDVECFDLAQSNSEHCRHWFFSGNMNIDGKLKEKTLFRLVKDTLVEARKLPHGDNSVIAYHDNSSAIKGFEIDTILPVKPGKPSAFAKQHYMSHLLLSAETHNFPSGVAPFAGAETGTGGRIRDVQATGIGANVTAAIAGYDVGNLHIPEYNLEWESKDENWKYPSNLAPPLQIEIEASNGASDYGNKFGEPVLAGFTRSFGMKLSNGERREWLKPIMFSGGFGQLRDIHLHKSDPEKGMLIVKIGGPAYRIGLGGGAASSRVQDSSMAKLDFDAVQRGDAEMENKMNRALRACIEMGNDNPIVSIHDQGAGGNGNVVKEICNPAGAKIDIRNVLVGDDTLSVLEMWGAEFQENDCLLIHPDKRELLQNICNRENVPVMFLGEVTGDGRIVVYDSKNKKNDVDMDLKHVLGELPAKTFIDQHLPIPSSPLSLPEHITLITALDKVFRLIQVGSKRFLTSKVDRCVTGLVRQQQCVGPLHIPLADVAVMAQSHFSNTGCAVSIGEQPIKSLLNPSAMARLTLGEAVTNIMWAYIEHIEYIKCSGNWMWAAKLPGEAASMYDACQALHDSMVQLGVSIDGGKDSLSMAACVDREVVKSPGTLVLSCYAGVPDLSLIITPDIKYPSNDGSKSHLLYIDLSNNHHRLGCTALAQVYNQIGDECPDLDDINILKKCFDTVQNLIFNHLIVSGHDRSDGGLITCLCEMAFAGNCGLKLNITDYNVDLLNYFFNEELGIVIEVETSNISKVQESFKSKGLTAIDIGYPTNDMTILISYNGEVLGDSETMNMPKLRNIWESTSFQLERLQRNPVCVEQEEKGLLTRRPPPYHATFIPEPTNDLILNSSNKFKVCILRQEGSNGDREMTSAFYQAGFEPWDVTVSDIVENRITLDQFSGLVFVGGFANADVLDSAKGWAGVIKFNKSTKEQIQKFYDRKDTFSLGVCNGCQLMALLGLVPYQGIPLEKQPRFIHNVSGRFESRFVALKVENSPSIMLKDMEGSVLGVWVAHGEGNCYFPDKSIYEDVKSKNLIPLSYVDDDGKPTTVYPFNPNGSIDGIAGLCTPDGRHLCLMPHLERTFLQWQWPWQPEDMRKFKASPWIRAFQNARIWCESHK